MRSARPGRRRRRGAVRLVLPAVAGLLAGCGWITNYADPDGPRYAGGSAPAAAAPGADTLTFVSFNIEDAARIDRALALLRGEPALRDADVLLLQEMDAEGTARIADALGMAWIYYPASVRAGRDFGNAVLSRWPIVEDEKLVLPHLSVFGERQRTATAATVRVGDVPVRVYSVHLSTPINQAERERRNQLEAVLRDARGWRHVVIGGDLNAGSFGDMAARRGFLWPTEDGPRTVLWGRWDHIFLKGLTLPAEAASGTVLDNRGASDHRPVWVRVLIPSRSTGGVRRRIFPEGAGGAGPSVRPPPPRSPDGGPMSRRPLLLAALLALTASSLLAHDLFLRPDDFFLDPGGVVRVRVLNGNFERSESPVTYDRVTDFALVGPDGRSVPPDHGWHEVGDTSVFDLRVGGAGTYLVAVSTAPRVLALSAADFNAYLESDGIPDVLEARRRARELEVDVREEYSKHVKAVVQAGDTPTGGLDRVLGHPAELVPLDNPYTLGPGDELRVRAVVDGRPVADQLVLAGGRTPGGERQPVQSVRTDADGVARVRLAPGAWYVKFIHMVPADSTDYVSKWATLTFGVR